MKYLHHAFLFTLCLFLSQTIAFSQQFSFGVAANAGFSYIGSDDSCPSENVGDVKRFSSNVGLFMEQEISKNTSLGLRASWVQIRGGERMWTLPTQITTAENQTQTISTTYRSVVRSNYLALPLYLRTGNERGGIKIGLTPMFFLGANSNVTEVFPQSDPQLSLRKMDLGTQVGFDWNLTDLMALSLEYYHGLRDIELKTDSHRRFNSQLTFGIQYTLYK